MSGRSKGDQQRNAADPAAIAAIEAEIERIQNLAVDEVRGLWRTTFKKDVPKALTRDLLVRMICWHIQEQSFGGHDRATLKILESYAKGKAADGQRTRRLKPGTEIVREYQGERHTVTITGEGYHWRGGIYPSLTAIARLITGTNWNGPRFFGLRMGGKAEGGVASQPNEARTPKSRREAKAGRGRSA